MTESEVHVVDYGLGNLGSIMNMFRRIGVPATLINHPEELADAKRILLPGVGSFDTGMNNLRERGFVEALNNKVLNDKTPVLGICLGMQLLTDSSEEGRKPGLGWIKAKTVDMRRDPSIQSSQKFPFIGWNYLEPEKTHRLLNDLPEDPRFYFVHTYMVECDNDNDVLATTVYGDLVVTAMAISGNIVGAQFHPEKSHKFGMQLLRNFSSWTPNQ